MQSELHCQGCGLEFMPEGNGIDGIWDRLNEQGPWLALGDGETVEDHIFAELAPGEVICCPHCATPVELDEANLGRLSLQLLGQW